MSRRICSLIVGVLIFFLMACQKDSTKPEQPITETFFENKSKYLQIIDENEVPIPDAKLMFGLHESSENPLLIANKEGLIEIPKKWVSKETITIVADSYIKLTLFQQAPNMSRITLKKIPSLPSKILKGQVSDIDTRDKDNVIDFAINMESLNIRDIIKFDIKKVISPLSENINVAGFDIPLPQNIYLPRQKESYFLLTLSLYKEFFSILLDNIGPKNIYTLRGQFPFKQVLSEVRNKKPYYELINEFNFLSGGDWESPLSSLKNLNVISKKYIFNDFKKITAPYLKDEQVMLGTNCLLIKNNFYPVDLKYFRSQETITLKSVGNGQLNFVGFLKNKSEFQGNEDSNERISSVILPWNSLTTYNFLPLIDKPTRVDNLKFNFDLPFKNENIEELGTLINLSELIINNENPKKIIKYKITSWEIFTPDWVDQISFPQIFPQVVLDKSKKWRIEVAYLGKSKDSPRNFGNNSVVLSYEDTLDFATHFTHSALDFN